MTLTARRGFLIGAAALAGFAAGPASGQLAGPFPQILYVDRERALRSSALAQELAAIEKEERLALRREIDELRAALEAEEAEIAVLREEPGQEAAFEARVKAFDRQAREARRTSQQKGERLQARFADARRRLAEALGPILTAILNETQAAMIVDARQVLVARPGADMTTEAIRRLDAAGGDAADLLAETADGG